jgi:uncharacterized protein
VSANRLLQSMVRAAARRPLVVIALAGVLALTGATLALGLKPSAGSDTLVDRSSASYQATQRFYGAFGQEPIQVLVKEDLQQLVLSSDIDRLLGLEGCLSGNVPRAGLANEGGPRGPCGELTRLHSVKVVLGPATFINEAALQINRQLSLRRRGAEAQAHQAQLVIQTAALKRGLSATEAHALGQQARKATMSGFAAEVTALALRYGLNSPPNLDSPAFVSTLVFDNASKAGTPKQRFAYLFPSRNAALISIRLKSGISQATREQTIKLIRRALAMPNWQLQRGGVYLLTGEPVIVSELSSSITSSIKLLLIAVLVVMAATLALIFTGRPRLLPLLIALFATALTFGVLAITGASLTMAAVALLPVLVGLSVDYAIQFQSRTHEELGQGSITMALARATASGGSTIATAALASAGALLVLMLSPVPMVRGFGVLLAVGLAIALICTLLLGSAILTLTAERRLPVVRLGSSSAAQSMAGAWRGAREIVLDNPLARRFTSSVLGAAVRHPGRVLLIGFVLAALGWTLDTQTPVQTDITKLVPQNLSSLSNLGALERTSGVGGEIDLMVSSKDLTAPAAIEWMSSYERGMLRRFGYSAARGCGQAQICPAFSLPDLLQSAGSPAQPKATNQSSKLTEGEIRTLLGAIPPYFSSGVITANRHVATLAFGIRLMDLSAQQRLIDRMRASLHPPPGVSAQLVGLPVLAAQSGAAVSSVWRRALTVLLGLLAVAVVLVVCLGTKLRRTLVPMAPIAMATGWSALVVFLTRVALNPMSVTLGVLVMAVSTEFSVLLSERYRQERASGWPAIEALRRSYRYTGRAVTASAVTAIAGFAVLVLSDIHMLRDFGLVTLIDLTVSLLGVLAVLPSTLMLSERTHGWATAMRRIFSGALLRSVGLWLRGRTRDQAS